MATPNDSMPRTFAERLRRALLLGLFIADLRVVTRLGLGIKHMRAQGQLSWDSSLRPYLQARARQLQGPLQIISYGEHMVSLIDLLVWLRLRRRPSVARFFASAAMQVLRTLRPASPSTTSCACWWKQGGSRIDAL